MLTNLRIVRLTKEMKLRDLATKAGLSPSFLSRIEAGKSRGSIKTRERIAQALGVTESTLFGTK